MERYFFWLTEDYFIYATFIAMNDEDLKEAEERGFAEVSPEIFSQANPNFRFIDGELIKPTQTEVGPPPEITPPIEQEPFHLRYFVGVDSDDYIVACYIGFTPAELDSLLEKGYPEISKSSYETIGPFSKLVGGKVVQGDYREPVVSPEGNAAIRDARISKASEMISMLTDATDPEIVDEVRDEDLAALKKWKIYRIEVSKVDISNPQWPIIPE